MAHALRRISYTTCDPEKSLFSFLAREPRGHFSLQYCHSFTTQTPQQVSDNLLKFWFWQWCIFPSRLWVKSLDEKVYGWKVSVCEHRRTLTKIEPKHDKSRIDQWCSYILTTLLQKKSEAYMGGRFGLDRFGSWRGFHRAHFSHRREIWLWSHAESVLVPILLYASSSKVRRFRFSIIDLSRRI